MTISSLDSALTGPLFATHAMRDCFADRARLRHMLNAEAALARAQARFGLVPTRLADALSAIDPATFDPEALGQATALSAVPTIPFVKALQSRLPPDLEPHLHKGATTQDILDTALVLQLRDALALLATDLDATLAALGTLADSHRQTPCVGRTYGQHAAPTTFGFKAAIWLAGIAGAAKPLPGLRSRLLVVSLAGPVGTLAGLAARGPAIADEMANILDLAPATIAWHTRRGPIAEIGCWIAQLLGALAKLATDVAHLASTEVAELAEPYIPGRGDSSAMPHKRNPVSCTVILAAHAMAPPLAAALITTMAALHERPPGLWHAEWHALPSLFGLASGALREARTLAERLELDTARMRRNIEATGGLLFADAVARRLAPVLGRAAAHALVEHAATQVRETGQSLRQILEQDPAASAVDLDAAFDLGPAIMATNPWIDRALAEARTVRTRMQEQSCP